MRRAILLLPRLLAATVLAALTLVGGLTLARPWLGERLNGLYDDWAPPLVGVQTPAAPLKAGASAWLAGEMQAGLDAWVNRGLLQRPAVVRAFNSSQWAAFGTSYMADGTLVRGREGVLFEYSYIGVHCGFDLKTDLTTLPAFARRLRAVQNALEARGQRFVYVVAAVKTPQLADHVPPGFACPARLRDLTYRPALDILQGSGVRVVDTRQVLTKARRMSPTGLYPRNGIHWNRQGTALAARALVDDLRQGGAALRPLTWRTAIAPDEAGGDRDLSDLLNLWRDPPGWPAPMVTPTPGPPGDLTLVAVNDSFFGRMADILREAGTFQTIRAHGYLTLEQVEYGPRGVAAIAMDRPAIRRDLLAADVVVLEEAESRLGGPFAVQFLELMEPALGLGPEAKPSP